jgi:hypothetical protein
MSTLIAACLSLAIQALTIQVAAAQQAPAPTVAPSNASDVLSVLAPAHDPLRLSARDLKALPHTSVTLHSAHTNADETYSGIRLADLLGKMGIPLGSDLRGRALANYIVATGSDGYKAVLALGEVDPSFHPGEVIVADTMEGKPLDAYSGPFKLVVTEDKRAARSVRNLTTIELKSAQ